jgi:hypothetical protein
MQPVRFCFPLFENPLRLLFAAPAMVNALLDGVALMPCEIQQDGHAILRTIGSDARTDLHSPWSNCRNQTASRDLVSLFSANSNSGLGRARAAYNPTSIARR